MNTTNHWQPTASIEMLKRRAQLLAELRHFFSERNVMEVETAVLSHAAATDLHLDSFSTRFIGPGYGSGCDLYLHTSPEYGMKRLLAAGSGPIYQIARVFRQGEAGSRHNPEFTMLEWYRPGMDYHALMDEVEVLIQLLLNNLAETERLSYAQVFLKYAGFDPFGADIQTIKQCAKQHGLSIEGLGDDERDGWLDLIISCVVEPQLGKGRLTFIYDYPASQAALAKIQDGNPPVAERFELYLHGVELANGFHELSDDKEQRKRFERDNRLRKEQGLPQQPIDENLLAALANGFPECAGVAIGIDRLLMAVTGVERINEVMAFDVERA